MGYPLCVDLDGTLTFADLTYESLFKLIKTKPWYLFKLPVWFLHGHGYLKERVLEHVTMDVAALPYNDAVIKYIQQRKATGDKIVLVTASSQKVAEQVAQHLGLFDQVIGSDEHHHIKGQKKAEVLCQLFGERQFDYLANDVADVPVWEKAHQGIAVNYNTTTKRHAAKLTHLEFLAAKQSSMCHFFQTIRVHQYVKNTLLFLPLFLSFQFLDITTTAKCLVAFIAFCLISSSTYVFNDLCDLEADRTHPTKKTRAFATGIFTIPFGLTISLVFLCVGLGIAFWSDTSFGLVCTLYYLLTLGYSFKLKEIILVDVLVLAVLFTLRILAGMMIIQNGYSSWLLIFSLFFFTSLAFIKRYVELTCSGSTQNLTGRGYFAEQTEIVKIFGIVIGIISVLIFSLYINSTRAIFFYNTPALLFLVSPLLLYWMARVWLLASEKKIPADPIVFALKDKTTYFIMGACILIFLLARFIKL